jgi:hypothetical protein
MKAIIIEIGKDYCIVLTRDGQFLKQRIPAGVFELGDEITVSEEYEYKPLASNIKLIKNFSMAASVAIILIAASVFGVWYMKYTASKEDTFTTGDIIIRESAVEEAVDETIVGEAREESFEAAASSEAIEERNIFFEKTYSFSEQKEAEDNVRDIISFSYKIIDNISLRVKLNNISTSLNFNGTLKLVMLLPDNSESSTEIISLEEFEPGEVIEHPLFLKTGETKLKLEVSGYAYGSSGSN